MKRFAYIFLLACFGWSLASLAMENNNNAFDKLYKHEREELSNFLLKGKKHKPGGGHANLLSHGHKWFEPTPSQPQGPFYPIKLPSEVDTDLTQIGNNPQALGTVVLLQGQVMDQKGQAIVGATVEIWQANAQGRYNHPHDTNTAPLDPNFQDYAKTTTNERGQYIFKTVVPGPYPASNSWWRPPHIHFKVSADGYKETITQSYFNGSSFSEPITHIDGRSIGAQEIDQYNRDDLLLGRLSEEKRAKLIVNFEKVAGHDTKIGVFSIYLKKN